MRSKSILSKRAALLHGGTDYVRRSLKGVTYNKDKDLSEKHGIDIHNVNWLGRNLYNPESRSAGAIFRWGGYENDLERPIINISRYKKNTPGYASALAHELKHYNDWEEDNDRYLNSGNTAKYERAAETEGHKALIKWLVDNGRTEISDNNLDILRKSWSRPKHYWSDGEKPTKEAFPYRDYMSKLLLDLNQEHKGLQHEIN